MGIRIHQSNVQREYRKGSNNYYFVNTTINHHGFHGTFDKDTLIYSNDNKQISINDLADQKLEVAYALFDSDTHLGYGKRDDPKWIRLSDYAMPEAVSVLFLSDNYKEIIDNSIYT